MDNKELTFNDLPQVVAQLRDEVLGLRILLLKQQEDNRKHQLRENRHKPMTVEEAAEYTRIPIGTLYMKLGDGTIPATKPGKRYVLYQDELDRWLEANRKNAVPLTPEDENEAILSSHKRKPNKADWHE
jgi:excisionase family DNA binding protein